MAYKKYVDQSRDHAGAKDGGSESGHFHSGLVGGGPYLLNLPLRALETVQTPRTPNDSDYNHGDQRPVQPHPQSRSTIVEVAHGIETLVRTLHLKFPDTKLGVVNLLPRGDAPGAERRIEFANRILQDHLTSTLQVYWITCYAPLVHQDGRIRQ